MKKRESKMVHFVTLGFMKLSDVLNDEILPDFEPYGWYIVSISTRGFNGTTKKEVVGDDPVDYYVHNVLFQRDVKVKKKKNKKKKKKNKKNKEAIVESSSKNIMV